IITALINFYSVYKYYNSVVNSIRLSQLISKKPEFASLFLNKLDNKLQIKCKPNKGIAQEGDEFYVWIAYSNGNEELLELKRKKLSFKKVATDDLPFVPVLVQVFPEFAKNYKLFVK